MIYNECGSGKKKMKDLLINSIMNNIGRYYDYDKEKIVVIRYGLSSLYLNITKTIVIFLISYLLGYLNTLLLLMTLYSLLRLTVFGVHAKKSWHCWVGSLIIFIGLPYLCRLLIIDNKVRLALCSVSVVLLGFFAPADTEKRPLINQKRRHIYKYASVVSGSLYTVLVFFVDNNTLANCLLFSLLLAVFVCLPLTYKLFGVSYNNYLNYKKGE